jgi:hypothetical protein
MVSMKMLTFEVRFRDTKLRKRKNNSKRYSGLWSDSMSRQALPKGREGRGYNTCAGLKIPLM